MGSRRWTVPCRDTSRRVTAIGLAILAVTGCSMMNPYDHVPLVDDKDKAPEGLRLAGNASEGLKAADDMRQTYYNNLRFTSYIRSGTAVTAGVLSGWALYNALKPNGSGPDASEGDTRRGVRLGVTLGTLYGMRQLFVNPEHESIHAEGYRSLTCLMLQSAPLLMTQTIAPAAAASAPSRPSNAGVLPPRYNEEPLGELDRLQLALDRLEERILALYLQVARDETNLEAIAGGDKAILASQKHLTNQIRESKTALDYARHTLADGRFLVRTIQGAGREIRDRVGIIVSVVNGQVQNTQNNFRQAADVLKDAHDIASGILNIGVDTAADQTARTDATIGFNLQRQQASILLAGPMSAAGELFPRYQLAQAGPARTATPGAPAPAAASAPAPAASPVARTAKKAVKPAAASKDEPPTAEELQAIRDKLDLTIKAMAARQAEAAKKEAEAILQKQVSERDKTIDRLTDLLGTQAFQCRRSLDKGGCATDLAQETERLYAARRPIVQELLNFRRKTRAVLATPECAELAVLRVTPNEVLRGRPGDTLSYIVRQRAPGNPAAMLEGPVDDDKGVKFDFVALQATSPSLFMAKIKIGPKMEQQTIRLVVTDSKGIASQTIAIVAGGKPPADAPAAAASGASGAGKGKE